jgi:hypothetical protein
MDRDIAVMATEIRRERVERARRTPMGLKLAAGGELFDYAAGITMGGIRMQNPSLSDEQVLAELKRRLELKSRRD